MVEGLRAVSLSAENIPGGLALSTEAGWNQVAADWRFMLDHGSSFGFADAAGRLVASGLTVDFADYAWISMILVTPAWRRRGLATRLMQSCIGALRERGLTPALDASPEGRQVYLKLGFADAETSTRLAGAFSGPAVRDGVDVAPISAGDLTEIAAYDARSSGTDRAALLRHLAGRMPAAALVARRAGRVSGFAMARDGRMAGQIGPLVAEDDATALALLAGAGHALGGPVCLDLVDTRAEVRAFLDRAGFAPVTRFIRMVHGPDRIFPQHHRTYAIGGPELS